MQYYRDAAYLKDVEYAFESQFEKLYYLGPLRESPKRQYTWSGERPASVGLKGELAIPAFLAGKGQKAYSGLNKSKTNRLDARIAQWLAELNLAASFEVTRLTKGSSLYSVKLQRQEESPEVLISDMGIGVSQVLPVLVLCYYVPAGATIIFEQPELHLHPAVQAGLADVFVDVIKKRKVQILLESHSEHLLRRLQRRLAEEELDQDDLALYFCENCGAESKLTPLKLDMFGGIHNWPKEFFGSMASDVVASYDAGLERKRERESQCHIKSSIPMFPSLRRERMR